MTLRRLFMGSAAVLAFAGPAAAEMRPTLSFAGVPGLIDMPGGEHQSDGMLSFTGSTFGSISHQTLTFQIAPWVSGSFRYGAVRNWDDVIESDFSTYLDRSFDLRFRITEEGQYVPAITVGFQDFIGTSLSQAEYIVATKTFADKVKVTAGLGWGRLASNGGVGGFGTREPIDIGEGGTPHIGNWFKGDIAPFAGIEWKVSNKLTFKAEYSSDAYTTEAEERQTFDYNSPSSSRPTIRFALVAFAAEPEAGVSAMPGKDDRGRIRVNHMPSGNGALTSSSKLRQTPRFVCN